MKTAVFFLLMIGCCSVLLAQQTDSLVVPVLRFEDFCKSLNNVVTSSHNSFLENEEKELNVVNRDIFTSKLKFDGAYSSYFKKDNSETHFIAVFYEGQNSQEADTLYFRLKQYLSNCLSNTFQLQGFSSAQITTLSDGTIRQYMGTSTLTTNSKRTVLKLILINDDQLLYRIKLDVFDLESN